MRTRKRHCMAGFSLLEMSVVLAVLGTLALGLGSQWESIQSARQHNSAQASLAQASNALHAYLLRNRRLPCPARASDMGFSALPCPSGFNQGLLPYASLGLEPDVDMPLHYAVYRGADADLVNPATGQETAPELAQRAGIEKALVTLARRTSANTSQPHHPRTAAAAESDDCSPGSVTNPAFVVLAPVQALSTPSQANGFDGLNQSFSRGASLCSAAPGRSRHAQYDDLVLSEPASTLLGWIVQRAR